MKKFIEILGSVLIAVVLIAGAALVLTFIFGDRVPIMVEVPKAASYKNINRAEYIVATNGIEDARNATVTYQSTSRELEHYGQELRYISGKIEPLTTSQDPSLSSDIPTDIFPKTTQSTSPQPRTQVVDSTSVSSDTPATTSSETETRNDN